MYLFDSIGTSTVANNSDIVEELTPVMTLDLSFLKNEKSPEFTNKEAAAG